MMHIQLQISRAPLSRQCVVYSWACRQEADDIYSGTANSIEASLVAAATLLACHEGAPGKIEIAYRQVVLGSFPVSDLDNCAAAVADLIVERYDQTRIAVPSGLTASTTPPGI